MPTVSLPVPDVRNEDLAHIKHLMIEADDEDGCVLLEGRTWRFVHPGNPQPEPRLEFIVFREGVDPKDADPPYLTGQLREMYELPEVVFTNDRDQQEVQEMVQKFGSPCLCLYELGGLMAWASPS